MISQILTIIDEGEEPDSFWSALQFKEEENDEENVLDDDFTMEVLQLYKVFIKQSPEPESHIIATEKIKKELLTTEGVYILDVSTEISIWIGKNAQNELKEAATDLLRVTILIKLIKIFFL